MIHLFLLKHLIFYFEVYILSFAVSSYFIPLLFYFIFEYSSCHSYSFFISPSLVSLFLFIFSYLLLFFFSLPLFLLFLFSVLFLELFFLFFSFSSFRYLRQFLNFCILYSLPSAAIVRSASECVELVSQKMGGKVLQKRDLVVFDDSNTEVRLTLWGEKGDNPIQFIYFVLTVFTFSLLSI